MEIVDRTGATSADWRPGDKELRELLRHALTSKSIGIREDKGVWVGRMELAIEGAVVAGRGVARAAVAVRLWRPDVAEEPAIEASGLLERSFDSSESNSHAKQTTELLRRGLPDLLRPIHVEATLRTGTPSEIEKVLEDGDPQLRKVALRVAALRKEKSLVPALIRRLKDDEPEVVEATIGALAAVGDRRAVRPLCELMPLRNVAGLVRVLDAIATLGGEEAQAYLEFVALGHESVEVRDIAKQALEHMRKE